MTSLTNYFHTELAQEFKGIIGLLESYIGKAAANAVYAILLAVINLVVVFVIIQQIFRLLHALQEKNSADEKERADAMITVKGSIITIIIVGLVFGVGLNAFFALSEFFITTSNAATS
ncbi:MAG: hypothetical protein LBB39_01530 [Mycoplasmataceae bacterium]|jgi:flagellar biosynthesis/type III secretory pathway M-ring protein FliF/YscJ|nr:hypothetical protein [Mycoplasmataceae bacterium]